MIIDSSALVAILRDEPEAMAFMRAISEARVRRMSAANLLEASIVIDVARSPVSSQRLDDFLKRARVAIEPVTPEQAQIGRAAYRDFGKGSRHPAQLNFGDCFAYALAKTTGEPLLFKGNDFSHTDIRPAI